jgi:hypothetical protein
MIDVSRVKYEAASKEARDQWDILDPDDVAMELWVNDKATQWIYWAVGETFEVSDGRLFYIVETELTAQTLLFHFWSNNA